MSKHLSKFSISMPRKRGERKEETSMAISVKDIQEKEFPTQASGYAVEQVDDFLDEIAAQLGTLIRENLALAGHVKKLEEELGESRKTAEEAKAKRPDYNEAGYFKNLESAMRESLIGAQRLADETKTKAQAEADELLNKAREEAQQTVNDAKAQAEALTERTNSDVAAAKAEYDKLHASAEEYRASFRKLIEAQLQTLKANDLLFK